ACGVHPCMQTPRTVGRASRRLDGRRPAGVVRAAGCMPAALRASSLRQPPTDDAALVGCDAPPVENGFREDVLARVPPPRRDLTAAVGLAASRLRPTLRTASVGWDAAPAENRFRDDVSARVPPPRPPHRPAVGLAASRLRPTLRTASAGWNAAP